MKSTRKLTALMMAGAMTFALLTGCASTPSVPTDAPAEPLEVSQPAPVSQIPEDALVITDQGVFAAGGIVLESDGTFDPVNGQYDPTGQTHHADHASVFYQIPAESHGHAMMFLHGYG